MRNVLKMTIIAQHHRRNLQSAGRNMDVLNGKHNPLTIQIPNDLQGAIPDLRTIHQYNATHSVGDPYAISGSATRRFLGSEAGSNMVSNSSGVAPNPALKSLCNSFLRSISLNAKWIAAVFVLEPVDFITRSNKSPSIFNVSLIHT